MIQKFPGKISRKCENSWISEMWTFNQTFWKFQEQKKENLGKKLSKIWIYHARMSPFLEFFEDAVPLTTGNCRKLTRKSWSNGKCPVFNIQEPFCNLTSVAKTWLWKKVELGVVIIGFTFKFSPACREASITKNFIFYDIIFKERRIL